MSVVSGEGFCPWGRGVVFTIKDLLLSHINTDGWHQNIHDTQACLVDMSRQYKVEVITGLPKVLVGKIRIVPWWDVECG